MKIRKSRLLLLACFIATVLILSACQVNFITDITSDGSGTFTQELGFRADEAAMAGLGDITEDFCAQLNSESQPDTTTRQETRGEDEIWCIYDTPFSTLDELLTLYGSIDTRTNDISITDGTLTYDITLDLSGSSEYPIGADLTWVVVMPGKVIEHNAAEQDGKTLTWNLVIGSENNIRAVSNIGGLGLGSDGLKYILIGSAVLCLGCFLPLVISMAFLFLFRHKIVKPVTETPTDAPTP